MRLHAAGGRDEAGGAQQHAPGVLQGAPGGTKELRGEGGTETGVHRQAREWTE